MNHRRALRSATDSGVVITLLMVTGIVLWTTDEVLVWNILPDWIDACAQLIVIIVSLLACFAVVVSLMCSSAVVAEAAAERAGLPNPAPSRRIRVIVLGGALLALTVMFALHKIDEHREEVREEASREKHKQRYFKNRDLLKARIPGILSQFAPDMRPQLSDSGTQEGDASLARLLRAIHASTPLDPAVSVLIRAEAPYRYCIIRALRKAERLPDETWRYVSREYLIDLPRVWERYTLESLFRGVDVDVPHSRRGVFIDTWQPSVWGFVQDGDSVEAVVMLRAS